jgi:hypothetical protein
MAISFPEYKTSVSGTPGLTPRFLRIAPLAAKGATGSVWGCLAVRSVGPAAELRKDRPLPQRLLQCQRSLPCPSFVT